MIIQAAIQAATAVVRAMREAEQPAKPHTRRSIPEHHRPIQVGPELDCEAPGRYFELLNCNIEVSNVLQAKTYHFCNEQKVPIIKKWLGRRATISTDSH